VSGERSKVSCGLTRLFAFNPVPLWKLESAVGIWNTLGSNSETTEEGMGISIFLSIFQLILG
jgi:hypothetical protein